MRLKLLSLNAKGLNSPYKRKAFWTDALKLGSDTICMQESHFTKDKPPKFTHPKLPHIFHSNNTGKKKGVITAIKDTVNFQLLNIQTDSQGRYMIIVTIIDNDLYNSQHLHT